MEKCAHLRVKSCHAGSCSVKQQPRPCAHQYSGRRGVAVFPLLRMELFYCPLLCFAGCGAFLHVFLEQEVKSVFPEEGVLTAQGFTMVEVTLADEVIVDERPHCKNPQSQGGTEHDGTSLEADKYQHSIGKCDG